MVKIQIECWVVMPHSVMVGYQYFRSPCYLQPHSEDRGIMDISDVGWYPTTTLHSVTTQMNSNHITLYFYMSY